MVNITGICNKMENQEKNQKGNQEYNQERNQEHNQNNGLELLKKVIETNERYPADQVHLV